MSLLHIIRDSVDPYFKPLCPVPKSMYCCRISLDGSLRGRRVLLLCLGLVALTLNYIPLFLDCVETCCKLRHAMLSSNIILK